MKIIKRNQLTIIVVSLMLITAGYLNFTTNNETNNSVQTSLIAERDDSTLGDAALVSSSSVEVIENTNASSNETINQISEEAATEEVIDTSISTTEDYYFTTSKLERNNMYSQLLETYQEMYNNTETAAEQKQNALNEITKINKTKNAIMISENLIIAKGFKDVIIFVNNSSISVIIKAGEITQEQIAQIQNIVCRELEVDINNIHISTK